MSDLQTILAALERTARRLRLRRALRLGSRGLLWGAATALLLALGYHLLPLPDTVLLVIPLAPVLGALGGACLAGKIPTRAAVARHLDKSAHLEERLSTAVELADAPDSNHWRRLVLTDAATRVRALNEPQLVPLRVPASGKWSALPLTLCALTSLLPVYRSPEYLRHQADAALVRQTGSQLAELTRHSLETRPPALASVREALTSLANTGAELERKTPTRAEALRNLEGLADKLREQARELGSNPALQRLEQAARPPEAAPAELRQQIDSLRQQLGGAAGAPEKLDALRARLDALQPAAQAAAQPNAAGNPGASQNLAEALSALAREAREMGIQSPALDDAIAALAANQPGKFVKDLKDALADLDKLREMNAAMRQLQSQGQKPGRDLAEQLQGGQVSAAQNTLREMIRQLQSAGLSPGQLRKLMQDVGKAVDPAGNYGQVGEQLKNACQQLQAGRQGAAANSLDAAAKELASLKQQFDDLRQMADAVENLNRATAAMASGKGWGAAGRRPGAGQEGPPGAGVGTWAADGLRDWAPQTSRAWDNSGIARPDMNPRGLADRGGGEGATEGMKPDQVKGQISRGAPMPSIALKGLSLRGQSRVALEEAATAAQQEAQAALSQDKVPRAYQGPVRDYFDDLKK